ncbi:class I SAM-dependent methyltransferase [Solirubrobacter ginsenosidimutans]|uniref:Class I SAM-dependent methyltransferase n=1 Tax=Solirubrobacter ginsenosidimutans TaxID=490573 RepID=A0A9X3S3G3_9ACTN|nr:class I SAM-dependent methyltransferase [Solirubrobacter ginsenosidimutans]MDA0165705.1 class I SAM-dependent methyltransferase [Solirubrobacter ginsenosidimutans]
MARSGEAGRGVRAYNPSVPFFDDLEHEMTTGRLWARVGAWIYDPSLALGERRGMAARRRELLASAHGRVLELGAGTGLNLAHYSTGVGELVLSEPEPAMRARLARRVARAGGAASVVAASAEELPFAEGTFDTVVSTLVLCSVRDPLAALREVRRVLAPGGRLLMIEHVRAAAPRPARRQDRMAGAWAAFAQGCRCNQSTLELVEAAGLRMERVSDGRWRGMPALVAPLVSGAAVVAP